MIKIKKNNLTFWLDNSPEELMSGFQEMQQYFPNQDKRDKRYLVFSYYQYDSGGAMTDMKDSFDTIQEAIIYARNVKGDFKEIYDRIAGCEIETEDIPFPAPPPFPESPTDYTKKRNEP